MKPLTKDLSSLTQRLREFLGERNWELVKQSNGLSFYRPPEELGIKGKFSIAVPDEVERQGMAGLVSSAADSLSEIYGFASVGDLLNKSASFSDYSRPTRLIARFLDYKHVRHGSMPLSSLSAYTFNLYQGLYRTAKFKLGSDNHESKIIAESFVKDCSFLQTEIGSFVAKVEIPHLFLKQEDLFGGEALVSTEVCSSLFSGLKFLNDRIISDVESLESQSLLGDALSLFDVDVLESLTKVVVEPEIETIDFTIEVGTQVRTSSTGLLTPEKSKRLKDFFELVKDQLRSENDLNIVGSIVELRSRDPEGNKNYIKVVSVFHGDRTFISATLSNEQYQMAVEAHKNKRSVRLSGRGLRLKTQLRMLNIDSFSVA